jgi:hypothetical protein
MKNNTIWALVTGLAVGFLVGREYSRHEGPGGEGGSSRAAANGPTEIPKDWITEKDLNATDTFAGLTPQQRYLALKVLNTKPCDCGCPHGSIAKCKKDDPGCPVAPKEIEIAAREAKAGKDYEAIFAMVKKPDAPSQQAPAAGPQKVELAAWTPIRGPKLAKVTIVEFSDFQ